MSIMKPKRFWKKADAVDTEGGWKVELDGRPVRTPAKTLLVLPSLALAEAVAVEWDAQEEEINPNLMPFTRMANSALDKVAHQHGEVADMLAEYGGTDLLCYRATSPQELIDRQAAAWDPVLDWAAENLSARLHVTSGVLPAQQDATSLNNLRHRVHALDNFRLAAFHDLVSLSGSLILGFAALEDDADPQEIWTISQLDEEWQIEQWGMDEEAAEQAAIKRAAFLHAKAFYDRCAG